MYIEWKGAERFTSYGIGAKGNILNVPDRVGESYIEQGLAVKVKDSKPKSKKVINEESE